ncbi:SMI1/KNR4 family protein [Chryseobacterium sp. T16E-39]|uniref:SMI1/KNR4 family protein n=1 Tax=Chryseobacterium sp. T16E-39 TaxID=2015076 RepID=UPI000B5B0D96|nr:SMI1/KNR4 family protein [Chryseobacterium sp. T16E-39]ASK31791.1 SMI1/KNR4 family protein [Chryseobacterium sp. T16E-39]
MELKFFKDFDLTVFWDNDDYSIKEYIDVHPDDELISSIERDLGYKLSDSYIELMKLQNGGTPKKTCFPTFESTSWAEDHVAITGIMGIGRNKRYSLCGELGSQFMITEWGYPNDGIYICDCPSAGHDMILLDYSKCGKNGEPEVVHVDQEDDYKKTFVAKNFETFIKGLKDDEEFD